MDFKSSFNIKLQLLVENPIIMPESASFILNWDQGKNSGQFSLHRKCFLFYIEISKEKNIYQNCLLDLKACLYIPVEIIKGSMRQDRLNNLFQCVKKNKKSIQ